MRKDEFTTIYSLTIDFVRDKCSMFMLRFLILALFVAGNNFLLNQVFKSFLLEESSSFAYCIIDFFVIIVTRGLVVKSSALWTKSNKWSSMK